MRSRHAVALALVGWYLMVPRLNGDSTKVEVGAPLAQWIKGHEFPTQGECDSMRHDEAVKVRNIDPAEPVMAFNGGVIRARVLRERAEAAQCIAADDPRLKDNDGDTSSSPQVPTSPASPDTRVR